MSHYSNPTENAAIGAVDREIKMMRKRAEQIKIRQQKGLLTADEITKARRQFVGIYARFLKEALS